MLYNFMVGVVGFICAEWTIIIAGGIPGGSWMDFHIAKWDSIVTGLFVIMSEVLSALQDQFLKIF